jgi:hypothetical protein
MKKSGQTQSARFFIPLAHPHETIVQPFLVVITFSAIYRNCKATYSARLCTPSYVKIGDVAKPFRRAA